MASTFARLQNPVPIGEETTNPNHKVADQKGAPKTTLKRWTGQLGAPTRILCLLSPPWNSRGATLLVSLNLLQTMGTRNYSFSSRLKESLDLSPKPHCLLKNHFGMYQKQWRICRTLKL